MKQNILIFLTTAIIFLIADSIWLGFISFKFYRNEIGTLLKPLSFPPAIIFYFLYVFGMMLFVIYPSLESFEIKKVIVLGFAYGLISYATYDLTNLATLQGWTWKFSVVDILWGASATSLTTTLVTLIFKGVS